MAALFGVETDSSLVREMQLMLIKARGSTIVNLSWCKGHSGFPGNKRADALTRKGAEQKVDMVPLGVPVATKSLITSIVNHFNKI